MKPADINRILILGSGTMGRQIGALCAVHGYRVTLYDMSDEILSSARTGVMKILDRFLKQGLITVDQSHRAMEMIGTTTDSVEAAVECDLVSESLPEDPVLKGAEFARFNNLCPARTIFTTNTSTLIPSEIAPLTGRPDRFVALHFHNVTTTNVVDVMPHLGTSSEVVQVVEDFAKSLGQEVISIKRENHGYVFNAMLSSLFASALGLAANGVASVEDIDRAWMGVMRTPIGPFGIMDQVGLTTVYAITNYWAQKTRDSQSMTNAKFLKKYIDEGKLGQKVSKGFYEYPNPSFTKSRATKE